MTDDNLPTIQARAPVPGRQVAAFIPGTSAEILWTIQTICKGGLVPDSYKNKDGTPNKSMMAIGIMKGLELGVPPLAALANIAIINGRPTMWGDLMVAMVQRTGLMTGIKEIGIGTVPAASDNIAGFDNEYGIQVEFSRKGVDGPFVGIFTVGDAKRAKLWMNPKKHPWLYYPKRMLRQRAAGFALRDGFADCLAGMYFREEIEDFPDASPRAKVDRSFLDGGQSEPVTVESQPVDQGGGFDHPAAESVSVDAPSEPDESTGWPFYREDGSLIMEMPAERWADSLAAAVDIEAGRDGATFPVPTFKANQKTFKEVLDVAGTNQKALLMKVQDFALGYGRKGK